MLTHCEMGSVFNGLNNTYLERLHILPSGLFDSESVYESLTQMDETNSTVQLLHIFITETGGMIKLKANRLHPCNYLHTPTDFRHTDKHLRLVMVLIALISTAIRQKIDLDLWLVTLTFNLDPDL